MLSYPSGMTVSSRALGVLSDALRAHRNQRRTRWRRLSPGRQALLVVAHLRKGGTYADLACGFRIGTSTVYRYLLRRSNCSPRWLPPWPRRSRSPAMHLLPVGRQPNPNPAVPTVRRSWP